MTQAALAELIRQGHYASHIRRMRLIYARRRSALVALVQAHLGAQALPSHASNAGLHLVLSLGDHCDDVAIADDAARHGVLTRALSRYYTGKRVRRGLLLGYACVEDEDIAPAFFRLLQSIDRHGGRP
ncbi:hypothetical protein [Thauera sp. SDU_THAU2]|uniref:hypothetical protein n=1 Tax=Thauera sp. SDU_THAU2 TaxID=3136633 RepID=UPI00311E96A9